MNFFRPLLTLRGIIEVNDEKPYTQFSVCCLLWWMWRCGFFFWERNGAQAELWKLLVRADKRSRIVLENDSHRHLHGAPAVYVYWVCAKNKNKIWSYMRNSRAPSRAQSCRYVIFSLLAVLLSVFLTLQKKKRAQKICWIFPKRARRKLIPKRTFGRVYGKCSWIEQLGHFQRKWKNV